VAIPPRIVIAGTHSGCGKTTLTVGITAALYERGRRVATAKVGPDYIDTGYLTVASRRQSRNLDVFLSSEKMILPLAKRAAGDAEFLIVEGVMGLYDGIGSSLRGSTAHVSKLLYSPVILVVDASSMSLSVAALVNGYLSYDPDVRIGGIILNRVGSARHESILRDALARCEVPVIGAVPKHRDIVWPSRHLGLVPPVEYRSQVEESVARLSEIAGDCVDLDALESIAGSASPVNTKDIARAGRVGDVVIGYASGAAFSFLYADNMERLTEAGAALAPFDPLHDTHLPSGVRGLYLCGGFPEVYAESLAANSTLLNDIRSAASTGMPIWAECGGLSLLSRRIGDFEMAGVVDSHTSMRNKLVVGYRTAKARSASFLLGPGESVRGHEFHHTVAEPAGDALDIRSMAPDARTLQEGFASASLFASYLHVHMGADPTLAERFVSAACQRSMFFAC
jgi:cobyrinic acid a,c-diamide synthase